MASLSIRGQRDIDSFIASFAGSHRLVTDYLLEEVLKGQPNELRDFLLSTSVLERFTAPLCDHITGLIDSLTVLTKLEQSNLFLVPLDESLTLVPLPPAIGGTASPAAPDEPSSRRSEPVTRIGE